MTAFSGFCLTYPARTDSGPGDSHLSESFFGRVFRATHSRPHASNPRPEAKTQNKTTTRSSCHCCLTLEKDHRQIGTKDAAKQVDGCIQTLLLTVDGMDCPSCALKLTKAFLSLPLVQDVKVNIFTGRASLTHNTQKGYYLSFQDSKARLKTYRIYLRGG